MKNDGIASAQQVDLSSTQSEDESLIGKLPDYLKQY